MNLLASVVVRAANKGDLHGYLVEIERENGRIINSFDDYHHLNCIESVNGRVVYLASKRSDLREFPSGELIMQFRTEGYKHNFKEVENCFVCNLSEQDKVAFFPKDESEPFIIPIEPGDREEYQEVVENDDSVEFNWLRGLTRIRDKFYVASSPARIFEIDYNERKITDRIDLSDDVHHAVHGLEAIKKKI